MCYEYNSQFMLGRHESVFHTSASTTGYVENRELAYDDYVVINGLRTHTHQNGAVLNERLCEHDLGGGGGGGAAAATRHSDPAPDSSSRVGNTRSSRRVMILIAA